MSLNFENNPKSIDSDEIPFSPVDEVDDTLPPVNRLVHEKSIRINAIGKTKKKEIGKSL